LAAANDFNWFFLSTLENVAPYVTFSLNAATEKEESEDLLKVFGLDR
jgi:hypothetical protein